MIGTTTNDRYQLDEELGRGGMGTVYQAFDNVLKRDDAVKVLGSRSANRRAGPFAAGSRSDGGVQSPR